MAMLCKGKRPKMADSDVGLHEEGVSSESMNNVSGPPLEDDSSDTSLKLG